MGDGRLENLLGVVATAATDRLTPVLGRTAGQRGSAPAALVHLAAHPGESVEQLSHVLGISQPGTVAVVDRLVTAGMVERRTGRDRRTHALHLTPAGHGAADDLVAARAASLGALLTPLDDDERARLEELLGTVVAHLAADRPGARRTCRLCDRPSCTAAGCPLDHTVEEPPSR